MELALGELQERYAGRAEIARLDAKRSPELLERYGITCLPTILLFEKGHVVRRLLGTAMPCELEWALQEIASDNSGARRPGPGHISWRITTYRDEKPPPSPRGRLGDRCHARRPPPPADRMPGGPTSRQPP